MSVITNKWNDESGDSITIESPSFQGNQTVKISSPVQKGTSKRSMKFIGKCKKDSSKQVILTVEQEASVYTYDLILSSDNTEIAAKGGTANITAVLKTYRNGNLVSTDNVTPVLSGSATGFSISGTTVTASNRTTIVGTERSITVTGKFSNTFDGQTVSANIVIKQEANSKVFKELTNKYVSSNPYTGQNTVKANGGTVKVNTFAIYNYTSGSTSETDVSSECTFTNPEFGTWNSNTHVWTCPSAGTTVYEDNRGTNITVKWNDKTTYYYLYQEANTVSYSDITITKETPINLSANMHINIKVSDGLSYSQKATYTSGATTDITTSANITYSVQNPITGFMLSNNILMVTSNQSLNPRNGFVVRINILLNGKTAIKDITYNQAAGYYTYANPVVTLTCNDVPASGGSVKTGNVTYSQTYGWNGATTGAGVITEGEAYISWTGGVDNIPSLGTTVKSRTKVGVLGVTVNINGKSDNTSADIYQAENKVTNSNYNPRITAYGTPTVSIGSGLTAAGGSATVSASVTNTETYNALYSSGATGPNQTRSVGGNLSISMTANGNSRFSLSGNTITHSSMETNETTDTVTIKVVNDGDNSKSATASKSITNNKTVKSTSGGVYTYGDIVAGAISNKTIPASGGSATATAGNGTQSWNKSATITTYQYTSGSTKDVTTEAASSGTNNVAPSIASINATASSKGTIVSAQTTVKSQVVTWSANGKSASGTMYIYQEANAVIDDNYNEHLSSYGTPKISIMTNQITAAGGTARAAGVVRNTYTYYDLYTSGSTVPYTKTKAGVYKIEMISNSNNRFSMDDTYLITHSSMGTNVTTDIATFRCYNEDDRTKYVDESVSVSNRIESYNYGSWNISISANPTSLPATGGTSTITASCSRSKTPVYTSGSTGTATTESATPTLALTTNPGGFTLSGNKLTAANNPIGAKTATVTASYSGATSKSVSVSQAAGPDGIGYMQIQGDGTSHPIFRVGGNTRSVEPMSINETSETASDEDVSIFASIKKFLTKFV
jgi:hypothetical protein|uniref:Uncharacterized protein n=1 Tax=CrAss-like virus sp. ctt4r3 TaxID=2823619 RepID=A0A8S5L7U7_9CAUD|nr:MAG TPA: hypothetical protein [CrAss-like virus sp. ctt4r3]